MKVVISNCKLSVFERSVVIYMVKQAKMVLHPIWNPKCGDIKWIV